MARTIARPEGGYKNNVIRLVSDYPDFRVSTDVRVYPTRFTAKPAGGGAELTAESRDALADKMDAARRGRR